MDNEHQLNTIEYPVNNEAQAVNVALDNHHQHPLTVNNSIPLCSMTLEAHPRYAEF